MPANNHQSKELALDRAIDALMAGEPARVDLPCGRARREVNELVDTARLLRAFAIRCRWPEPAE